MSLVESLKRMEAILDKMDSTIDSLERTFAKKEGDTIIDERIRQSWSSIRPKKGESHMNWTKRMVETDDIDTGRLDIDE